MARVTLLFAVLLIALGLVGFLGTGSLHPTALIPTWFGLLSALAACWPSAQREPSQAIHAHQRDHRPSGLSGRGR